MKQFLLIPVLALALTFSGCGTVGKVWSTVRTVTTYETTPETADAIILNAQKTALVAGETVKQFMKQERRWSSEVKQHAPKVHEFADYLRERVPDPGGPPGKTSPRGLALIESTWIAIDTFKANRTPEGEANLRTALATVTELYKNTKAGLTSVQALKGP